MSSSLAKHDIMTSRKLRSVETVAVSKAHAVYLCVKKYPGLTKDEYMKGLIGENGITRNDVHCTFHDFVKKGYFLAHGRGRGENQVFTYEVDDNVKYNPKPTMRKIAPNDIKAQKSLEKKAVREQAESLFLVPGGLKPADEVASEDVGTEQTIAPALEVKRNGEAQEKHAFELIQGLAAIDPDHPHFGKVVREEASKLGIEPEYPHLKAGPVKPIATMFIEVGSQLMQLTLQDARQLYRELHAAFGEDK